MESGTSFSEGDMLSSDPPGDCMDSEDEEFTIEEETEDSSQHESVSSGRYSTVLFLVVTFTSLSIIIIIILDITIIILILY